MCRGVMKMGNTVPRAGHELTSLAFRCATITPCRLPDVTHAHLSMQLLASEVSADYYTCPPEIISLLMLTIIYIQAIA